MMKTRNKLLPLIFLLTFSHTAITYAQIPSNVYYFQEITDGKRVKHELKINENYLIQNIYETNPNKFVKTIGGYFTIQQDTLKVDLEFNSNYEQDSITKVAFPYTFHGDKLVLHTTPQQEYLAPENLEQELDGHWLFATRGPDNGQERRDDTNARKTLKVLQDNTFQWIAYRTETMKFSGTGGGYFSSENGVYSEKIQFFSRDDSRVGAELKFNYELKDGDWHHTGNNSKGEPMYEIWARRGTKR
ncbi:hypothetical protein [Aggregatimonas sangjinii]|nr:hypothetical protein [Aggregatimonas sangjinii]